MSQRYNTSTTGGFIMRGLQNVNGEVIPWQFQGVDANKMQLQTPTMAPLQQQGLELLTFVIMQCITNGQNDDRPVWPPCTDGRSRLPKSWTIHRRPEHRQERLQQLARRRR
ncbi:hypothetical protein HFO55_26915 [Rhizobium leguminosarum]|uniref:hypothetical protein n=1 Tax=Rhizobium leguminosarum TaxID=384 RepID=UPI001C9559B8|nr:hypothetical protein [Rhizobium leguminosarum]MBY5570821.1 hypothetical protein [Rhizobium leguminosarum]MBY5578119.1 hypothetical protein [Rhizobium leguminosarum]